MKRTVKKASQIKQCSMNWTPVTTRSYCLYDFNRSL